LDFRVLGPLEVEADRRPVRVGGRQRVLLAILLLRANKFVDSGELVEAIWGARCPANPRAALHTCVTRLRNALGAAVVVEGGEGGYRLVVDEADVDVSRFESAVVAAHAAGEHEAELLTEALGMWRGVPLSGMGSDYLSRHEVPALVERRLQIVERKVELELSAGRHEVIVSELQALTAEHPLRERFWALLMTALFNCCGLPGSHRRRSRRRWTPGRHCCGPDWRAGKC
jgi:DNA-binding SARP family transcriptional activator